MSKIVTISIGKIKNFIFGNLQIINDVLSFANDEWKSANDVQYTAKNE